MVRGTLVGSLCALIPGTGPTIASFIAYAAERKVSRTPERFGRGAIEGLAAPEAATHSSVQGDFIPTMSLGIPGDAVMALLLAALMIQGIHARAAADLRASGHLLGPDRELLGRQHAPGDPQRADDRHLGAAAADSVSAISIRAPCSSSASASTARTTAFSRSARCLPSGWLATSSSCSASIRRPCCLASSSGRGWRKTSAGPWCISHGGLSIFVIGRSARRSSAWPCCCSLARLLFGEGRVPSLTRGL